MIPNNWRHIELSKLFEFKNGLNAGKESYGTGVKFINVMEVIYNNHITEDKIKGSVTVQNGQLDAYLVKKGDVLFNRTSETQEEIGLASVYLDDAPVVFGGFVIRARPLNDWLDDNFKKYCFLSNCFREQVIERGQGGIRTNIGQTDLEKVKLLTPPPSEQKYIAQILSTWDKSIEALTQLIAAKRQLKKGLMQQLLTGKKRIMKFANSKIKFQSIYKFAKEVSERNKDNQELTVLSCTKYNGLVPSLEFFGKRVYSKDLTNYKVVQKQSFAYATNHIEEGSIGYQVAYEKALISPMYTVFITDDSVCGEYLFPILKSHFYIQEYKKRMEGSIDRRGGLRWEQFSKIEVPVPSLEEQKAIADILNAADRELKLLETELSIFKQQKQGLMQQLLTGKKRVKV